MALTHGFGGSKHQIQWLSNAEIITKPVKADISGESMLGTIVIFCGEKKMTGYLPFTYHQAFSLFLSSFLRPYLPMLQHIRNSQIDQR